MHRCLYALSLPIVFLVLGSVAQAAQLGNRYFGTITQVTDHPGAPWISGIDVGDSFFLWLKYDYTVSATQDDSSHARYEGAISSALVEIGDALQFHFVPPFRTGRVGISNDEPVSPPGPFTDRFSVLVVQDSPELAVDLGLHLSTTGASRPAAITSLALPADPYDPADFSSAEMYIRMQPDRSGSPHSPVPTDFVLARIDGAIPNPLPPGVVLLAGGLSVLLWRRRIGRR